MRHIPSVVIAVLLSACATTTPEQTHKRQAELGAAASAGDPAERCSVYVYRNKTSFQALNPEKPYLYVGDEKVGTLSIGESICLHLLEGKHSISVKEPILFMPAYTSGSVEVEVAAGNPIYVRYAKEFSGVAPSGSGAIATGSSKLQVVTEEQWKLRQ